MDKSCAVTHGGDALPAAFQGNFRYHCGKPVDITEKEVQVRFDRRAHLPIVLASGLLDTPVNVSWWNGMRLRLTA